MLFINLKETPGKSFFPLETNHSHIEKLNVPRKGEKQKTEAYAARTIPTKLYKK
jgi:hypothetical protein